jgi:N-methylhydantoinase A
VGKGVAGIAICLLWSFQNPDHEHQIYNIIKKKYPDIECTCSVDLAPVLGEYQRTVATVINVYIKKMVVRYLEKLIGDLKSAHYDKPLFVMSSSGGMTSVADACVRTLQTIDSGPVGGTLGAKYYAEAQNEPNVIATDVGGTSFDVSLIDRGMLQIEKEPVIDQYKFFWPRVMARSVGAGGGSIAKVVKGVMQVGPESAGSKPGPACYGLGGTEPTVTDADVVLGYINPDYFVGGRMKLDKKKAEAAIKKIADELDLSVIECAAGIKKVIDARMADLIRICTIEKGFDPRNFILTCFGGSGPLHAAAYAADVMAKRVIIPYNATVFSAAGMLTGQLLHTFEYSSPLKSPFKVAQFEKINTLFEQLEKKMYGQFSEESVSKQDIEVNRTVMMRFSFQFHQVEVFLPNRILSETDEGLVERLFHESYETNFGKGTAVAGAEVEIVSFRVTGVHSPFLPKLKKLKKGSSDPSKALKGERLAYSEKKGGLMQTKVYDGDKLSCGYQLKGPAIVERWGDTVVIPDGQEATVDEYNNIVVQVGGR